MSQVEVTKDQILGCELKDKLGLNDFQQLPTQDLISIQKVGINRYRLPVMFEAGDGTVRSHDATASMCVSLNEKKNGVSMSRLCTILVQEVADQPLTPSLMIKIIERYREELRDETDRSKIEMAQLKIKFAYARKQQSLKSGLWGWQYYPLLLEARYTKKMGLQFFISVDYEYSSTCPCSLSMAKQYEAEYAQGLTTEGVGIGVAHGQRSMVRMTCQMHTGLKWNVDDVLDLLRLSIPTETQSMVKRIDEQAFAILNGSNPMFVEHASKRIYHIFNNDPRIVDWHAQLEHYESLHSHNAAAVIYKGVEDGLRGDDIF